MTIKDLMIAVGGIAALLALYRGFGWPPVISSSIAIAISVLVWLVVREHPPVALWIFAISTFTVIVPMALLCIYCHDDLIVMLLFLVGVIATGLSLGSGVVWITAQPEDRRWRRSFKWLGVVGVGVMPLSMAIFPWPLSIAFAVSKPSMERIADRVAAGGVVNTPEWAGIYRIVGAEIEPRNGNVGLFTDVHLGGRSGFVRVKDDREVFGPMVGLNENLPVGGVWRYQIED